MNAAAWYDTWHEQKGLGAWRPPEAYGRYVNLLPAAIYLPNNPVLDIGCGVGHFCGLLKSTGAPSVIGIDFSQKGIQLASETYPDVEWYCREAGSTGLETASMSFIFCLGALEHFPDIPAALREMVRVARPEARLFILVPNKWFPGRLLMPGGGTPQKDTVREVYNGLHGWTQLFQSHGLRVVGVHADNWPMCRVNRLYRLIWKALPLPLSYTFMFRLAIDKR